MNDSMSRPLPSGMFWRIFRKDWRLLKLLAITNAVLQGLLAMVEFHAEPFSMRDERAALAALITLALIITMCLLIVLVVQQDAIPGVNQDWKVRPIKRHDLLIAKLLSVALFIHGPIVAVKLLQGLAEGFSFAEVLRTTLLGNLEIAMLFTLPVMTIAALTRSIGEALLGSLAVFLGLMLVRLVMPALFLPLTHSYHFSNSVDGTGVEWVWRFVSHALLLVATVVALGLQYFRRSTLRARVVFVSGLLLFMLAQSLPWKPAFAIQQWFATNPGAGATVSISFDPSAPKSNAALGGSRQLLTEDSSEKKESERRKSTRVILPLRFSGLPAGTMLHTDRCVVRLVANGRTLYRGEGGLLDVPASSEANGQTLVRQRIEIPASVYKKTADQPLRVELEYSLTLLRPRSLPSLTALNGYARRSDLGRCATRVDSGGTAIEVACRHAGELPFCLSMALEREGRRNPEKFVCDLNYEPPALRFDVDPVDHAQVELPFRDPAGLAHFPVDESDLHTAQVAIKVYEPQDHVFRRLVVPDLRPSDWRAATAVP
jgi:hypothetical protein